MVTQKLLKELLCYDEDTGIFIWRERDVSFFTSEMSWKTWNTRFAGVVAGSLGGNGYLGIRIFKKSYKAHRLAWLYVNGSFPHDQTDHIDGDRVNNRIENLREATNTVNQRNRRMLDSNTSGVVGVHWYKRYSKWQAEIGTGGKQNHLGYFKNKQDAIDVRKAAEIGYDYHENHGRV